MADQTAKLPALPGAGLIELVPKVSLRLRTDWVADRLSEGEMDALCPVLPELASELLMVLRDDNDKG